jgi:molybdopterin-guanine dinucleotide biosynthesis protein A
MGSFVHPSSIVESGVVLGDFTLVDHVLRGLPSGIAVIVVGPDLPEPPRPVFCTRESPVGGGPVAGLAAGLDLVTTQIACVIATDMPFAGGLLSHLTHRIPEGADALVPVDAGLEQQHAGPRQLDHVHGRSPPRPEPARWKPGSRLSNSCPR